MKSLTRLLITLATLIFAPLSVTLPAAAAPAIHITRIKGISVAPPPTIPLVAPGAAWTGVPGSGGVAPTDPVRSTAKPAAMWWTVPFQNLATNTTIGISAFANGGIAYVDYWVDGRVQRVTTPSLYSYVGGNGQTITRFGYWITLDIATANATHPNGGIDTYAEVVANDGTMQHRVIGGQATNSASLFDANIRFQRHYNVTSKYDFTADFCPSGCTYTTLDAALTAIRAGSYTHPRALCKTTGFYELTNRTLYYEAGQRWTDVAADAGQTCTFGRAASYNIADQDSWIYKPQFDWIHWKGPGAEGNGNIIFEQHNFTQFETFDNRPYWFDGVTFTNSSGTRDTYYFNMGGEQPTGPYFPSYWTDNTYNYMGSLFQYQRLVTGNKLTEQFTEIFSMTGMVAHNYTKNYTADFFHDAKPLFSLTYTGAASPVTFTSTFGFQTAPSDLNCGGTHFLYSNAKYASQQTGRVFFYLTAMKAQMESECPGVTMAILEPQRSTYWWDSLTTTNIKAPAPVVTLTGHWEIHADWYHFLGDKENVIVTNNVTLPPINVFGMMNNQCSSCRDVFVGNNTWGDGFFGVYLGSGIFSHYVMASNTYSAATIIVPDTPSDSYSLWYGNISGQISLSSGSTYPLSFNAHKNIWLTGGQPNAIVAYPDNATPVASQTGFYVDSTSPAYNYTPAPGGPVALYTAASPNLPRDWRQLLRATLDAIGAWVNGGPAPVYP